MKWKQAGRGVVVGLVLLAGCSYGPRERAAPLPPVLPPRNEASSLPARPGPPGAVLPLAHATAPPAPAAQRVAEARPAPPPEAARPQPLFPEAVGTRGA